MGVVYRAWNLRLKRVEAVKVISAQFARDVSFRQRFERETEIAANLDHPHIVTIYDCGEGPDGELFIAMRYVEGTTLERLIHDDKRLTPALVTGLISQIASALDLAHANGLVHRDIKPANILIAGQNNEGGEAYLTDFGLAKRLSSQTALTSAGLIVGTIDYMAPEQVQGLPLDLRADVYALGATLFRALTGEVPFPRETDVARMMAKLRDRPPRASQIAPALPGAWDAVLARALSQDPAERQRSAGQLAAEARAALAPAAPTLLSRDIAPGAVLGECLLEELIGEGGMGVVYRGVQLKLDRPVAVKVMSNELAHDPAFRSQFERECKIAASIDHPNVVPIYSAGEAAGRLYVVMAYVGGGTVSDALFTRGPLDPARAIEVIEQIAAALDAAHARGLVHRDIKPGNVLIDERTGRVLLSDFGIAKALTDQELTDSRMLGSARYMAPERTRATILSEIPADVYSLGCMLWDLLAGTERPDLQTVPGVSRALAEVVARATDAEPTARYPSAGHLARAARDALVTGAAVGGMQTGEMPREPFAPKPLSSGLSVRVLSLCEHAAMRMDDVDLRGELHAVADRLRAPLALTVLGGTNGDRAALVTAVGVDQLGPVVIAQSDERPQRTEALLIVMPAPQTADLNRVTGELVDELAPYNCSSVDSVCALVARDPAEQAEAAIALQSALDWRVAAVVPVSSRLAEAARSELITQELIERLGAPDAEPERVLGERGVRAAEELRQAGELTVAGLRRRLRELSGMRELVLEITGLGQRADALKAARALDMLEQLSYRGAEAGFLRDEVEALRFNPQMHVVALVRALERCVREQIDLPEDLRQRLDRLVTGLSPGRRLGVGDHASPSELTAAARAERRRWKAYENGNHGSLAARRIAEVVARSLQLIARESEQEV